MEKLRLLSLFSGIGAFEEALKNINIDYELVNYCEIVPYISESYSLIHKVNKKSILIICYLFQYQTQNILLFLDYHNSYKHK